MKVSVKIINAFSIKNTGGNPAAVILDAGKFTTAEKQLIAAKLGISETAFVSPSAIASFKLEFFTPVKQIAHCGHATIATFSYLKQIKKLQQNNASKETIDGTRNIYFEGDDAFMEQQAPAYTIPNKQFSEILASIHIKEADLMDNLLPTIVNTGNSFLIIAVKDESILQQLQPNFDAIKNLSQQLNLVGFYVFTTNVKDKAFDASTRMFAPYYGIDEEAETGMAAGPLACYLYNNGIKKPSIIIQQGKFMQQPSISSIKVNLNIANNKIVNLFAGGGAYSASEMMVEI
jgi:PhzF family phenazine biosynthesis protein